MKPLESEHTSQKSDFLRLKTLNRGQNLSKLDNPLRQTFLGTLFTLDTPVGKYLIVSTSRRFVFQRDFSLRFNDWYNLEICSD